MTVICQNAVDVKIVASEGFLVGGERIGEHLAKDAKGAVSHQDTEEEGESICCRISPLHKFHLGKHARKRMARGWSIFYTTWDGVKLTSDTRAII